MAAENVLFLMGEDFDVFFDALEDDEAVQNLIEDAVEEVFLPYLNLSGLC